MNDLIKNNWMILLAAGAAYWYWRTNNPTQILNNRYPMAYR
ncbi:hypothetical protein [Pseudoduganella namucuonensis]|uniref:Uncharacterized protein n=1 Tax=Pseudoduganella namucuonensis TaxID=1035707 RepID=A0A1I7M7G4_9BURK|nr:hypothetical protein [Pseudoduganella namucuonensis]SFV17889.1 hypothetical protein SAMN05216552_108011 [Pseudoduganella namucuonensis]